MTDCRFGMAIGQPFALPFLVNMVYYGNLRPHGGMADAPDLKSGSFSEYRFKSGWGYQLYQEVFMARSRKDGCGVVLALVVA